MEKKKDKTLEEKRKITGEALKALREIDDTMNVEDMIKDNMIKFKVDSKTYRIRQPNSDENKELFKTRQKKYIELMKDDDYLFRKQWIELYKKKGINIAKMDKELIGLRDKYEKLCVELAQLTDTKSIERFVKEVEDVKKRMEDISIEQTDLLAYSIEEQIRIYSTSYICYLVLEISDGKEWKKLFNTFQEFEDTNNVITTKALSLINYIIYRVK